MMQCERSSVCDYITSLAVIIMVQYCACVIDYLGWEICLVHSCHRDHVHFLFMPALYIISIFHFLIIDYFINLLVTLPFHLLMRVDGILCFRFVQSSIHCV